MFGIRETQDAFREQTDHKRGAAAAFGAVKWMIALPIIIVSCLGIVAAFYGAYFIWASPLQMSFMERYSAIISAAACFPIYAYSRASNSKVARALFFLFLIAFVVLGSRMWWSPPPPQDQPIPTPCSTAACAAAEAAAPRPDLSALRVERRNP